MVKGRGPEVWLPRRPLVDGSPRWPPTCARCRCWPTRTASRPPPPRWARSSPCSRGGCGASSRRIEDAEFLGKLNGATGTYGAHRGPARGRLAGLSREFVEHLGLPWNPLTTQIESHDWQSELYADVARFNRVLHNMCTDVWSYISMGYFDQVRGHGTVGSSTMPHKVNPIRFENAEANLEVSNALLDVLAATLVQSRLQRDLTDSSMQRNIGSAFGHSLLAIDNAPGPRRAGCRARRRWPPTSRPTGRCSASRSSRRCGPWVRVASPGWRSPTSGSRSSPVAAGSGGEDLVDFVQGLGLPADVEERLAALTPEAYVGLAPELVDHLR